MLVFVCRVKKGPEKKNTYKLGGGQSISRMGPRAEKQKNINFYKLIGKLSIRIVKIIKETNILYTI